MLAGLGPKSTRQKQSEIIKVLQSLKFIQKDEEDVDEIFYQLRARNYDEYLNDTIG